MTVYSNRFFRRIRSNASEATSRTLTWLGLVGLFLLLPVLIPWIIKFILIIRSSHLVDVSSMFTEGILVTVSISLSSAVFIDYCVRDPRKPIPSSYSWNKYYGLFFGILCLFDVLILTFIGLEKTISSKDILRVNPIVIFWLSIIVLAYSVIYSFVVKQALFDAEMEDD